ncbi:MAG: hypothetical protein JSV09_13920 [Thermoplasmata archaeon]|nr:MAG: hypothetical protein JSV09_13920 [Thermoplasmata archaeon]
MRFARRYPPATLIHITFLVISFLFVCYAFWDLNSAKSITREDGIVEYIQAILYILGAGIWGFAFIIAPNETKLEKRRRVFYILFMVFFIFLFLEEISYGQRLFGISTPDTLKELNLQDETNIHNIGTESMKYWIYFLYAFLLATLGIIIPLLKMGSRRFDTIFKKIGFPIVHHDLIICFGISLIYYYEPGINFLSVLRIICLLGLIIIVLSGKFRWLFDKFENPVFQVFVLFSIGFLIIGLNFHPEAHIYIEKSIAWETGELFVAMSFFFFSAFEAYGVKNRTLTLKDT